MADFELDGNVFFNANDESDQEIRSDAEDSETESRTKGHKERSKASTKRFSSNVDDDDDSDADDSSEDEDAPHGVASTSSGMKLSASIKSEGITGHNELDEQKNAANKRARRKKQAEKRKKKFESKDAEKDNLKASGSQEQSMLYNSQLRSVQSKMSNIELEERLTKSENFVDTSHFKPERKLENFSIFIKTLIPSWKSALSISEKQKDSLKTGSPTIVIVTHAGIRAADIIRALDEFSKLCRIGKLFAKHFKVEEQVEWLKKNQTRIVVGTPSRLSQLVEEGALSLSETRFVVIDCERNSKGFQILQMDGVHKEVFEFVFKHCLPLCNSKLRLSLF